MDFFNDLYPKEPPQRRPNPVILDVIESIEPGVPLNLSSTPKPPNRLGKYAMPNELRVGLNSGLDAAKNTSRDLQNYFTDIKTLLNVEDKKRCLSFDNYAKMLDLLLFVEEHQMMKDIRNYDVENITLKDMKIGYELEVPGLAEHRPSLIRGDAVHIKENRIGKVIFEGIVHQINESSVLLKFSERFSTKVYVSGKKFFVSFTFNRHSLRTEHQAVEYAKKHKMVKYFFPKAVNTQTLSLGTLNLFNKNLESNPEQKQAVACILKKTAYPAPYVIFGPPGTGKTVTLVEAVKQIHRSNPGSHILICTPSNSAADQITKHLLGLPKQDVLRYVAISCETSRIPQEIKRYCNVHGNTVYHPEDIFKYRIVISTLVNAAKLLNWKCPERHFDYVFVDEAGQATETETLIPIAGILSSKTGLLTGQIVLVGDPRQLGPVIHSTLAKEYGFDISMLERLIDTCEPYRKISDGGYNPNYLTKLLYNYRSHPAIINQSNKLFYDDQLKTKGDEDVINFVINCDLLPNPKFPVIFHNVVGVDMREKNSPSFFNVEEIKIVVDYLDSLIGRKIKGYEIKAKDVAVISPYKKQVDKIRTVCKKKKFDNALTVCSTEQIQGQERKIIIISTVRSQVELIKFDKKFHLGFLENPKRFNVAITRARSLLIVVGNANLLQYEPYWCSFLNFCKENNSTTGPKFDMHGGNLRQVTERFSTLAIDDNANNPEDGPSFIRGNV